MRSFTTAALLGAKVASAFSIGDYILAAGWTPASAPSFQTTQDSSQSQTVSSTPEPCGLVSKSLAESGDGAVDVDLAYQCLRSVPLDREGGLLQIEGIEAIFQFQTTLAYLKNPPAGYLYPPVDIDGGLEEIKSNLQNNGYSNEYDFQMAIFNLVARAYDGHFYYLPDIVNMFDFSRSETLFSLSADGISLPQVWLGGTGANPTEFVIKDKVMVPISKINGQDAESWLNDYASQNGANQDPDANYNSIFPTVPSLGSGSTGVFANSYYYQGPYTTITFVDGTTRQINHTAFTSADFTGVTDGKTFFEKFCTPSSKQSKRSKRDEKETPFEPVKPGLTFTAPAHYPKPVVALADQSIAGYFPPEIPDLAVLSIPSFEPKDQVHFSNTVRTFLATARGASKKKLMIDLRGNGGGDVILAYDTFVQLFPQIYPYGGNNFRATPLVNDVGSAVSGFFKNLTSKTATDADCNNNYDIPVFDYRISVDEDGKQFDSWEDFFGPHEYNGDNFTSIDRFNLDNEFSTLCAPVSNYRNLVNITPQVFQPQDVVIVQDGACASTCAVFTEFMKSQAGVRQIAFGGRSQSGPMQGVGGVKGASVYPFDTIYAILREAVEEEMTPSQRADFGGKYGDLIPGIERAISRSAVGSDGSSSSTVNMRNNIRKGDSTVTPLQFVYEAADCRIFYTPDMIFAQEKVWEAAYAARWHGGACVPGSTGQPSAEPGYLGLGGPTNGTDDDTEFQHQSAPAYTLPSPPLYTGTAPSGRPTPHSNATGIWRPTSSGVGVVSTWGVTLAPTTSMTSSSSPTGVVASNGGGVAAAAPVGLGVAFVGFLFGAVLLV